MPTGAVATWTPAVTTPNPTGNSVYAKPCSTTTYKIEIRDTSSACALCINEVLYKTIVVEPWSDTAKIIYPRSLIGCTDSFVLDYNDPLTCPQIGFNDYVWIDPLNRTYTGRIQNLVATSTHTGIWTLAIYNSKKGCSEELEFLISVGSCCISNPGFTFTGCNPVTFTNNSTGITLHTATLWNFGDGTSSNQFSPTHSYNVTSATVKNVCLTMMYQDSQSHSCCKRICQPVPVCPNPCAVVADFNFSQLPGAVNTFDFTDASTGTGTLCEYEWEFGDGSTTIVYSPNISHFYSTPGPWWVCLTTTNCIYDAAGKEIGRCTNKKCKWVYPPEGKKDPITGNPESEEQIPNQANILNIYPNPNAGDFVISLHNRKGEYQVIIRDKLGREVYRHLHTFAANPINIALQDIAPGIYTVEVKNDTEKFIEQISVSK